MRLSHKILGGLIPVAVLALGVAWADLRQDDAIGVGVVQKFIRGIIVGGDGSQSAIDLTMPSPRIDGRDTDTADHEVNARITLGNCTTLTTGAEDCDVQIQGEEDGSLVNVLNYQAGTGMTLGAATLESLTVTTDGTGTAEVALPAGSIDGTEILDGTITSADLSSSANVTATGIGTTMFAIPFCGQNVNNSTVYLGPALDNFYGQRAAIPGDTYCDGLDSTVEATADNPIATTFPAMKVYGMSCWTTADPNDDITCTARSAAADLSPTVALTITGAGAITKGINMLGATATKPTIAANATVAVKCVNTDDLSAQDLGCKLFVGPTE